MCSIFGYYKLKDKDIHKDFIQAAFELMRHRGPDYEQFKKIDERVGFGHQRLAIIDLDAEANQPMQNKTCYIIYNGEIYNYLELKDGLVRLKESFKTSSDTEVLLKGVECEGIKFLNKCNGMFVFAFYDKNSKKLILARDRFGVKPLHYMVEDGILYFSSEIKPLIKIKGSLEKNLNIYDSFIHDLATDYNEETFIKGIFQLKKGHYLTCDGSSLDERPWYFGRDFAFDRGIFKKEKETLEFTEDLLCDAISKRLRADVPLCITLSGGLDSATIYTLIRERLKKNITAFTFRHPGSATDEFDKVLELVGSYNDTVISVQSDHQNSCEQVNEALGYLEFPIWNLSALAYMDMYKEIRKKGFIVALEGHGADEQLGGYPDSVRSAVFEYLCRLNIKEAVSIYHVLSETNNPGLKQKNTFVRFAGSFLKNMVLRGKFDISFQASVEDMFEYRILPIVLRAFDRLAMRSSVESRLPFMDFRLVEFFREMPLKYKVSKLGSKSILRSILKKYNKPVIYKDKRKMGFSYDLPAFFAVAQNRDYMRQEVDKFDMKNYSGLKEKALVNISKNNLGWRDTECIWKSASLAVVNDMYGV